MIGLLAIGLSHHDIAEIVVSAFLVVVLAVLSIQFSAAGPTPWVAAPVRAVFRFIGPVSRRQARIAAITLALLVELLAAVLRNADLMLITVLALIAVVLTPSLWRRR